MGEAEVTHILRGRRFEFLFSLASAALWVGVLSWTGMVLRLPHIHGNLSNLFGFGLLGAFALAMLAFSVFFAFRLVFEIQGATVSSSKCVVIYRYLGKRTLELPYRGRIKRKVRLPDLKSQGGPRWGILIYRSMTQRVVIPLEMQGAEDLAVALTRS